MNPSLSNRPPLDAFRVIQTRDAEEMRHALLATYGGARSFEVLERQTQFAASAHDCGLEHTGLSYCHYDVPVRLTFDETHFVRQQFCLEGSGETRLGGDHLSSTPQISCTIPADMDSQIDFGAGYRQLVVRFSIEALTRKLASLIGAKPGRALRFMPFADPGSAESQRLRRSVFFLARELDLAGRGSGPGLVELEQLMMLNFLLASQHSLRHLLEREPADAAPWQVRRAEEFITQNWDKPLTIEAIASATGASARSIFKSFHDSRGYSPMEFTKMRRLERARQMLQTPDAATTVTGTALLCGFHNQGHFARAYRNQFGELPSETLNNNR